MQPLLIDYAGSQRVRRRVCKPHQALRRPGGGRRRFLQYHPRFVFLDPRAIWVWTCCENICVIVKTSQPTTMSFTSVVRRR